MSAGTGCCCLRSVRRNACIVVALILLGIVIAQRVNNSRLDADVSRLQAGTAALLRERVDLKWRAGAWEKEAVEWRAKNGVPDEPATAPPMTTDSDRESIKPPHDSRP